MTMTKEWRGQRQHPVTLIAAVVGAGVGLLVPLMVVGDQAGRAAPYLAVGFVGGLLLGVVAFSLLRPGWSGLVLVAAMFAAMFLFNRVLDGWSVALPPWILASFAGSVFGAHLRWLAERRRRT